MFVLFSVHKTLKIEHNLEQKLHWKTCTKSPDPDIKTCNFQMKPFEHLGPEWWLHFHFHVNHPLRCCGCVWEVRWCVFGCNWVLQLWEIACWLTLHFDRLMQRLRVLNIISCRQTLSAGWPSFKSCRSPRRNNSLLRSSAGSGNNQ